jgi:signal transduction histidine kinase
MLGHELRNPLGAITTAIHVLGTPDLAEDRARRAREIIARQSGHLVRLVEDLLDAGRMLTGKVALELRPAELAATVKRAVTSLSATGLTLEHRLELEVEDEVWVNVDEARIEQIITDLVTNAVKYTPPGGTVTLTVRAEPAAAVLEVRDTGRGIESELLPRIFDLFVQGRQGPERPDGGLGVGLALVKRLVEQHGGTVEARSDGQDAGSVLTVRLPPLAS